MKATDPHLAAEGDGRRFQLLVEAVTDYAIYMLDPRGVVTSWNSGAQRFKGYQPHEIIGEHFSRFYTEEDHAAGLPGRVLQAAAREGRYEGRLPVLGPAHWLCSTRAKPLYLHVRGRGPPA